MTPTGTTGTAAGGSRGYGSDSSAAGTSNARRPPQSQPQIAILRRCRPRPDDHQRYTVVCSAEGNAVAFLEGLRSSRGRGSDRMREFHPPGRARCRTNPDECNYVTGGHLSRGEDGVWCIGGSMAAVIEAFQRLLNAENMRILE